MMKNKGVVGMNDTPKLSTLDMQTKFDEIAIEVLRPAHDNLVDELEASTAAESLGSKRGNVQSDLDVLMEYAHTHENKDVIDKFNVIDNQLQYDNKPLATQSESFKVIDVDGQKLEASVADTLNLKAGQGVTFETDEESKTITVNTDIETNVPDFEIDFATGELLYSGGGFSFFTDDEGVLHWAND